MDVINYPSHNFTCNKMDDVAETSILHDVTEISVTTSYEYIV